MSFFFPPNFPAVPPKFETIMEDVDVQVGETCHLAVVVEGKPDPDILWFKVVHPTLDYNSTQLNTQMIFF